MVFTTLNFIVFMLAVFVLYYAVPKRGQWWILLAASYVFYGFASPLYLIFLLITTAVTFFGAVLINRNFDREGKYLSENKDLLSKADKTQFKQKMTCKRKQFLALTVVILLLMLIVLKYSQFLFNNVSWIMGLFGASLPEFTYSIILPVGLSFYMFQSMGYCIDVYRGVARAEKNFFRHALFVSYFPQIMQGPIGDYCTLAPQLFEEHSFSYEKTVRGLQRAAWGFFKKLVVANQIALFSDGMWNEAYAHDGFLFWSVVIVMYAIQLYADFSGYMDIAIGCSGMLGITLDENFDTPYFSKNIPEYWRNWHITLGKWFRNYVFYSVLRAPLCENLRKKYRKTRPYVSKNLPTAIGLLTVWIMIGFWHGADWSYVVHGLFHGCIIILATLMSPLYSRFHKKFPRLSGSAAFSLFRMARTFALVCIGYAVFRPANLSVTAAVFENMTKVFGTSQLHDLLLVDIRTTLVVFFGTAVMTAVDIYHYRTHNSIREKLSEINPVVKWAVYVLLLVIIIFLGAYSQSGLNQFAYFRF